MPHDPVHDAHFETNRARWDESVPIHAASKGYDLAGFLRGEKTLYPVELDEVGDVAGKSLLHLQCHFGMDTLGWARLGARVTGLDFSAPAIERARALALEVGEPEARFVQANVYDAREVLPGEQFDVVYTAIGALCWLPDIRGWAQVAASFVRPGGFLYVYDGHPMRGTIDDERADSELVVRYPYFESATPIEYESPETYVDGPPLQHTRTYEWNHGIGETATALIEAGLRIEFIHEHREVPWKALPWLERVGPQSADGNYVAREAWQMPAHQRDLLPLMFSIRAARPE